MSANYWDKWVVVFPGKMGISWKHAYPYAEPVSKAEADAAAEKNANTVAIPAALFERYKEYERRTVAAERVLRPLIVADYNLGYRMAHINATGNVVTDDGKTWTKPSEHAATCRRLIDKYEQTIEDVIRKCGEKKFQLPDLLSLSAEQLIGLDQVCPRSIDLTQEILDAYRSGLARVPSESTQDVPELPEAV